MQIICISRWKMNTNNKKYSNNIVIMSTKLIYYWSTND